MLRFDLADIRNIRADIKNIRKVKKRTKGWKRRTITRRLDGARVRGYLTACHRHRQRKLPAFLSCSLYMEIVDRVGVLSSVARKQDWIYRYV